MDEIVNCEVSEDEEDKKAVPAKMGIIEKINAKVDDVFYKMQEKEVCMDEVND